MIKKVITIIIIFTIVACSYSMIITKAATLGEQKQELQEQKQEAEQKLEYVQEELSSAVVKIQELDDTIKEAENDINGLESELKDLQIKIDEITLKLEKVENSYIENEDLLQQRLVATYEAGDVTYLDMLMHSASVVDFLSNYYAIQEIIQSDVELLQKIEEEKEEVKNAKQILEEQKATLKVKKAKKEQLAIITQNNKILKEQAMANLSQEEQELQTKLGYGKLLKRI